MITPANAGPMARLIFTPLKGEYSLVNDPSMSVKSRASLFGHRPFRLLFTTQDQRIARHVALQHFMVPGRKNCACRCVMTNWPRHLDRPATARPAPSANYRFFFFPKITFQLSL